MTDEELAAIRKSIEFQARVAQARDDNSDALLAEVDRLRADNRHLEQVEMTLRDLRIKTLEAENAAMRPIVETLAEAFDRGDSVFTLTQNSWVVTQARALLAKDQTTS